jgi:hypothetical protein
MEKNKETALIINDYEATKVRLSKELGREVHVCVFETEEKEEIIGYLKEPDRLVKMRALDMSLQSWTSAANILLETSLIKEYSDPRILDENPDNDKIYFGFLMKANELVKFYSEKQKKS